VEDSMIEELPLQREDVVGFQLSGHLEEQDYEFLVPRLEVLINEQGPLLLYIEMIDFKGWSLRAAWDDMQIGLQHNQDFKRIAMVGERAWQGWMVRLARAFVSADVRYFNSTDKQQALDWLVAPDSVPTAVQRTDKPKAPDSAAPYRHLLLPTDFSAHANYAALRAKQLAELYGARLSLLQVLELPIMYSELYDGMAPLDVDFELEQVVEEGARTRLSALAAQLGPVVDDTEVVYGRPKLEITRYAEENGIDLIVLGSHGYHGLTRLLGSTTDGVNHEAGCDVLSVRLPTLDPAPADD
jgi:universal stress protein A